MTQQNVNTQSDKMLKTACLTMFFVILLMSVCSCISMDNPSFAIDSEEFTQHKKYIKFEDFKRSHIPVVIKYEGEELRLLNDRHLVMMDDDISIDFMADDFHGTPYLAWYMALYNSSHLKDSAYVHDFKQKIKKKNGYNINICSFRRDELKHAPELYNYFVQIDIAASKNLLISAYFKSHEPLSIRDCEKKLKYISRKKSHIPKGVVTIDEDLFESVRQSNVRQVDNVKSIIDENNIKKRDKPKMISTSSSAISINDLMGSLWSVMTDKLQNNINIKERINQLHTTLSNTSTLSIQKSSKDWIDTTLKGDIPIKIKGVYQRQKRAFFDKTTADFYRSELCADEDFKWGIFEPTSISRLDEVTNLEDATGMNFDILLEYYALDTMPDKSHIREVYDSGKVMELTFQTSVYNKFNKDAMYDILDGKNDEYISILMDCVKTSEAAIIFRLNNEMNGDWCNYNALYYHKDTDVFITFWQWLRKEFEKNNVNNVIWVWNPNWGDFPSVKWNDYMRYFPQTPYVDVIGLTGYNTGTYYKYEKWRSFDEIYNPMIEDYNKNFKNYPYLITEFGCAAMGGNKQEWIKTALDRLEKLPIAGAIWWNGVDYDKKNGKVSRKYSFTDEDDTVMVFKEYIDNKKQTGGSK